MAGIAIKIQGANYSERGLGKVHIKGSVILITSITISGSDAIINSGQFSSVLAPSNTTQTEVVWSIVAGDEYATIDNTGLVTALNGANSSSVTIKCASKDNPAIYATKIVRVTYQKQTGLVTDGLINNFDAFGVKNATITDLISGVNANINGEAGENCIVVDENQIAFNSNNEVTTFNMINGLSTWTLEFVIEATGWAGSNSERTMYHDVSSNSGSKMQISLGKIGSYTNGAVFVRYNNAWKAFVFDHDTINAIDWSKPHVIQITREVNDANGMTFNLYIDGALYASSTGTQASNVANYAGAVNILSTTGARKLYAIRAYNKALTASEAAQNYEYNIGRYNFNI